MTSQVDALTSARVLMLLNIHFFTYIIFFLGYSKYIVEYFSKLVIIPMLRGFCSSGEVKKKEPHEEKVQV